MGIMEKKRDVLISRLWVGAVTAHQSPIESKNETGKRGLRVGDTKLCSILLEWPICAIRPCMLLRTGIALYYMGNVVVQSVLVQIAGMTCM